MTCNHAAAAGGPIRHAALAIANPITGDLVRMTNHHWGFSISAMQAELGLQRLVVINDFTALALSLHTTKAELREQLRVRMAALWASSIFRRALA